MRDRRCFLDYAIIDQGKIVDGNNRTFSLLIFVFFFATLMKTFVMNGFVIRSFCDIMFRSMI